MGLDIGPDSVKTFNDALDTTQTIIWNGPMGVFEFDKFAVATEVMPCVIHSFSSIMEQICTERNLTVIPLL